MDIAVSVLINKDVNSNIIYMDVNSSRRKRIRRTPEAAKALILKVAADRLSELGLDGLNISGVARAAGMSHATVIHHFGSTGAMRKALLRDMTHELLSDVMAALDHHDAPAIILDRLFKMLSQGGHGRLLAWLALERQTGTLLEPEDPGNLFTNIVDAITLESGDRSHARHLVLLVAAAAVGLSIGGDSIAELVGIDDDEMQSFPAWLADHIQST